MAAAGRVRQCYAGLRRPPTRGDRLLLPLSAEPMLPPAMSLTLHSACATESRPLRRVDPADGIEMDKTMSQDRRTGLTYADAGVDIDAGNAMVDRIKPLVRATRRPGADAEIGGFGGLFDLKAAGFSDPILVAANDGVGSKVKIAIETGRHTTIGIDLVAMCVNDLVVQGAEPLFFLDYFATAKLEPEVGAQIVEGIAAGCREAGAALDRRRDRGNAWPLCRQGLRPRGLRRRRGGTRHPAPAPRHRPGRSHPRPALVRRAFQRLFAGAQDRRDRRPLRYTDAAPFAADRRSRRRAPRSHPHLRQIDPARR